MQRCSKAVEAAEGSRHGTPPRWLENGTGYMTVTPFDSTPRKGRTMGIEYRLTPKQAAKLDIETNNAVYMVMPENPATCQTVEIYEAGKEIGVRFLKTIELYKAFQL
jgi:hypothetical protein